MTNLNDFKIFNNDENQNDYFIDQDNLSDTKDNENFSEISTDNHQNIFNNSIKNNYQNDVKQNTFKNSINNYEPNDNHLNDLKNLIQNYYQNDVKQNTLKNSIGKNDKNCANQNKSNKTVIESSNLIFEKESMICNLKWNERDQIINILNKFSAILNGVCLSNENKQNFKDNINFLIQKIKNLKLTNQQIKSPQQETNLDRTSEIYLKLDYDFKFKIINHLIRNHDLTISNDNFCDVNDDAKSKLIQMNKQMIIYLLDLEIDYIGEAEEDYDKNNFNLLDKSDDYIVNALDNLNIGLDNIKEKISEYSSDLMIYDGINLKFNVKFKFELENITSFLNTTSVIKPGSIFFVRNIPFRVNFRIINKSKNDKMIRYLEAIAKCNCDLKDKIVYVGFISIELYSNNWLRNMEVILKNLEFSKSSKSFGVELIPIKSLIKNGYIKDNKLKFSIKLVIDKVERKNYEPKLSIRQIRQIE